MTKLASVFLGHTSSALIAQMLLKDLLQELSDDQKGILDRLKACLPELEKKEEEEKKDEARIARELQDKEHDRQFRRLRAGPWWDERDELDFRPNA